LTTLLDFAPDEVCPFPAAFRRWKRAMSFVKGKTHANFSNGFRRNGIFPAALPQPRRALTPPFHPYLALSGIPESARRYTFCCTFCSLPAPENTDAGKAPGITRHHALRSPDFPPRFASIEAKRGGGPVHR